MKYLSILVMFAFLFTACEKEISNDLELNSNSSAVENLENRKSSVSCSNLTFNVTEEGKVNDCCIYSVEVNSSEPDSNEIVRVYLNGTFYSNYIIDEGQILLINICETTLLEFFVDGQLRHSEVLECKPEKCAGCDAIEFSSRLVSEQDGCCLYSVDLEVVCDLVLKGDSNYSISRNGTQFQSLKITDSVSIPVTVCDGETVLIEIFNSRGGLCYSEEFTCNKCCPGMEFNITSKDFGTGGDGCCEVTFEMTGPLSCIAGMSIYFVANGQTLVDLDPNPFVIRVVSCNPLGVTFIAKDPWGDICFEETPLIYCES